MTYSRIWVADTGPLIAAVDRADRSHGPVVALLNDRSQRVVIPALCVAEACYIIGGKYGPNVEAEFLNGLRTADVIAPEPDDWPRIADLVRQYADFPLGGADASIVALAERLNADTIITLDHRHFATIGPRHCESFRLLPK
jgi:predicted nucleic acid-binding protein